ncbi:MAG: signal recognition particle-docking protein FtsY, partial [Bacteroidetes bacterium]|nr:signal recognition particle-docking protein FtsY [Bacteroidota bacterium]
MGLFNRKKVQQESLETGLEKTRTSFFGKLNNLVRGRDQVDESFLDGLEELLVTSDVGVATTLDIIKRVEKRVSRDRFVSTSDLNALIRDEITGLLLGGSPDRPLEFEAPLPNSPHVIMVVGVNGVGKTTTIGKLAASYKEAGKSVLMGAGDTFRAAATEQLEIWAERAGVPIVKQGHGADPAAVAYDTLAAAKAKKVDVVLLDTAGRLHTKGGLMDELSKVKRVMEKIIPNAPHEVLLVLDASTGQNAIRQAEEFSRAVEVT